MSFRPRVVLAAAVPLIALVAGCTASKGAPTLAPTSSATATSTSSPVACPDISRGLVDAVQRYIDSYGDALSGSGTKNGTPAANGKELQQAVQQAQQSLQNNACDLTEFRSSLDSGLAGVKARGPVAKAVLLRLTASMTGTAKSNPTTVTISPKDDLAVRLAQLAPGSVAQLAVGTYRLTESLVLLDGVTLRGAGSARTVVASTAADTGILVLTDGRVEFRDLSLTHTGTAAADVVTGGPTSSVVLTRSRVTGARASGRNGGNGVLMTSVNGTTTNRGTTLEVTSSSFDHNAAAGILLTGGHTASVHGATFASNGNCGVCFSGASTGAVRDSTFTDNRIGVALLDQAKPALTSDVFTGGLFAVQASNRSTPVIEGVRVSGASRAAMIFADQAGGQVDGANCSNVPYGIVVSPNALPLLGTNSCLLAKGR